MLDLCILLQIQPRGAPSAVLEALLYSQLAKELQNLAILEFCSSTTAAESHCTCQVAGYAAKFRKTLLWYGAQPICNDNCHDALAGSLLTKMAHH